MTRPRLRLAALSAFSIASASAPAAAQQISGTITRAGSSEPIADAQVTLVDSTRGLAGYVRTDARGRYVLHAPAPGYYALLARRIGYAPKATTWILFEGRDTIAADLALDEAPMRLSGVTVEAERDDLTSRVRRDFGLDPGAFGGRILTPSMLAPYVAGSKSYIELLATQNVAFIRPVDVCVRSIRPPFSCLMVFVDGMRVAWGEDRSAHEGARDMINPNEIESIVVFRPGEATTLFGTGAAGGVVVSYTRRGVRR